MHQKIVDLIPGPGTCARQPTDVSLSHLPPPLPLSLKSINLSWGEDYERERFQGEALSVWEAGGH